MLDDLLTLAKKSGADAADAILIDSVSIAHAQRLGEIEKLERSEAQDLGLRVFVGKRQAVTSSTDHSEDSRRAMVERAVAMARSVPEDPHTGLAERDLLETDIADLDLRDSEEPLPEALIERAEAAEDAARAVEGVTNSEGAEASFDQARIALATTNGFFGTYQSSRHGVAAAVLAGEGLKMERDYDWSSAIHGADLRDAAEVGREAGKRAVRRLNPRKVKSTKVPVVFDPRHRRRADQPCLVGDLGRRDRARHELPQRQDGRADLPRDRQRVRRPAPQAGFALRSRSTAKACAARSARSSRTGR